MLEFSAVYKLGGDGVGGTDNQTIGDRPRLFPVSPLCPNSPGVQEPGLVDQIRQASNGNFALGSARFAEEIAAALGRRVTPGKSGRPRKLPEPESVDLF